MSNLRRDARCLIRQREPIHCWQLFSPTRFNELHKVARHESRRSFRFLSKPVAPIFAKPNHYKHLNFLPQRLKASKETYSARLSAFAPLRDIILPAFRSSVASHVAFIHLNRARCFGRKFTLWLQPTLNTRQQQLLIRLLNNVDTCWRGFGYQPFCCWHSLPEV